MASSNNLDALSADGELPFGHPGRRSDDTPEGFEPSPPVDQGPELDYTPDENRADSQTSTDPGAGASSKASHTSGCRMV